MQSSAQHHVKPSQAFMEIKILWIAKVDDLGLQMFMINYRRLRRQTTRLGTENPAKSPPPPFEIYAFLLEA